MTAIDVLEFCMRELSRGYRVALVTLIDKQGSGPRSPGAMMAVSSTGTKVGTIGGGAFERLVVEEAVKAIKEGKPKKIRFSLGAEGAPQDTIETGLVCGGVVEVFINVITPKPRVLIVGAGHVGKPFADIANILGFRVAIVDSDPGLANKERYPYAETILVGDVASEVEKVEFSENDLVFVAYGEHDVDYEVVKRLLRKGFRGHIWVLCSKRRAGLILESLVRDGVDVDTVRDRLHMPAGLSIGAETPEEIAISVLSEMICAIKGCSTPVRSLSITQ